MTAPPADRSASTHLDAQRLTVAPVSADGPIGCYPGSFNPPTVAHLAVAEAAVRAGRLHRLDLVLSRVALGKAHHAQPSVDDRRTVLEAIASTRPWLGVVVTEADLIVDIARAYDVVVMGTDKWRQVCDPAWYGESAAARDAAIADLPRVLVAPRGDDRPDGVDLLELPPQHRPVSATGVRDRHPQAERWWLPEAAAYAALTGAWRTPPAPGASEPPTP